MPFRVLEKEVSSISFDSRNQEIDIYDYIDEPLEAISGKQFAAGIDSAQPARFFRDCTLSEVEGYNPSWKSSKKIVDSDQWINEFFSVENLETSVQKPEEIEAFINSSKWILNLEDDWDDEGSQGYSIDTWERAISFLRKQVEVLKDDFCYHPTPLPQITPANKGSIDLSWELDDRQLLVNIPSDPSRLATYYGENDTGETTSGRLNTDRRNFALAMWLSCEV